MRAVPPLLVVAALLPGRLCDRGRGRQRDAGRRHVERLADAGPRGGAVRQSGARGRSGLAIRLRGIGSDSAPATTSTAPAPASGTAGLLIAAPVDLRATAAPQPLRPRRPRAGRVVRPRRLHQPVRRPGARPARVPRHGRRRPVGERDLPAGEPLHTHRAGRAGVGDRAGDEQHRRPGRRRPAGRVGRRHRLAADARGPSEGLLGDAAPAAVVRRVQVELEPGRVQHRAAATGRRVPVAARHRLRRRGQGPPVVVRAGHRHAPAPGLTGPGGAGGPHRRARRRAGGDPGPAAHQPADARGRGRAGARAGDVRQLHAPDRAADAVLDPGAARAGAVGSADTGRRRGPAPTAPVASSATTG